MPPASRPGKKGPRSKRRSEKDVDEQVAATAAIAAAKSESETNWGLFEPVRGILEPITSILSPILSAQVIIGMLMFLLAYSWFWPARSNSGLGYPITTPDRLAAYEEIWRREESELWDWLEDRVGIAEGVVPVAKNGERQKVLQQKAMDKKVSKQWKKGRMGQRQIDDAIKVTEERLDALKGAVRRKKGE